MILNRNKRGIAVNLKTPGGLEVVKRLLADADVVTENYRKGTLEKLGLGYEVLQKLNPRLVYCAISGYGRTGPYADKGGFDLIAQGFAGLMSITGEPGGPPAKIGHLDRRHQRRHPRRARHRLGAASRARTTGRGQMVETSLMEAAIQQTYWQSAIYFATGVNPGPTGLGAHPHRALPGVSHRRRLDQRRRREPGELGAHREGDRPSRARRRSALPHQRRSHEATSPRSRR